VPLLSSNNSETVDFRTKWYTAFTTYIQVWESIGTVKLKIKGGQNTVFKGQIQQNCLGTLSVIQIIPEETH